MQETYGAQGLQVLGITADPQVDLPRVREFVAKREGKHTILWDEIDEAHTLYGVEGIPVTFLIDRQGRIAEWHETDADGNPYLRHDGFKPGDEKAMEARVKELLAEK